VALVASQHPEYTAQQLVQRVASTTKPLPALAGKTVTGGIVDAANALRAGLPGAPTSLIASAAGPGEIHLSWTASPSPGVAGYKVERSTADGAWAVIGTTPAGTTTYVDSRPARRHVLFLPRPRHRRRRRLGPERTGRRLDPARRARHHRAGLRRRPRRVVPRRVLCRRGQTYATGAPIDTRAVIAPAPQAVYQTERFGDFTYTIPT
jgi:hypothetical protein